MAFYSDYSSEEDFDDDVELWNPNESIDLIQATQNPEEKKALKKKLLETFLEQQRPMLTIKMKDFLLEDGVLESFISFVNRLDEGDDGNNSNTKQSSTPKTRPLNPPGREDLVRRSFNVMEIFHNPMNDLDEIIDEKLPQLLQELFKTFNKNSSGNFYHFHKILNQLLLRAPVETTTLLLQKELLWIMLDYLHEPAVVDSMIDVFCCGFPKQNETIGYYKALIEHKVFDRIGEKIYGKDQPIAPFAAEFFVRLLEKLSSHELSGILFISLCRTSHFVDGVFKVIIAEGDSYPDPQKQGCASVLRELLMRSGEKAFEQHEFARPIPNMLSAVHDKLHEHAQVYVGPLCNVLVNMESKKWKNPQLTFGAYAVKRPFGLYTFALVEILSDLIATTPTTLDQVPMQAWRVLSNWFLEYSHNNLYHFLFFKIFRTVLKRNHEEAIRNIFQKYKFLSKVIEHYRSKELSDSRGFILLICNIIRLTGDAQPSSGLLRQFLVSHEQWKQFLPVLREDTLLQLKRYTDMTGMDEDDEEDEDEGIDLGSAYAHSLGFDEGPQMDTQSPNKKKKKKKKSKKKKSPSSPSSPLQSTATSSTTAVSPLKLTELKVVGVNGGNSTKHAATPRTHHVDEDEDEDVTPKEAPSWWKDLTSDIEKEMPHEEPSSSDWWKGLKEELQHLSSHDSNKT